MTTKLGNADALELALLATVRREAKTVLLETGLTPRQLAEQRAELLEACEVAFNELENHTSVPGVSELILPCLRAAIAKATGGA